MTGLGATRPTTRTSPAPTAQIPPISANYPLDRLRARRHRGKSVGASLAGARLRPHLCRHPRRPSRLLHHRPRPPRQQYGMSSERSSHPPHVRALGGIPSRRGRQHRPDSRERHTGPSSDGWHRVQLYVLGQHLQRRRRHRHPDLHGDESRRSTAPHLADVH